MRLGIAMNFSHSTPEEWVQKHSELGLRAVVFPCQYTDSTAVIDAYKRACQEFDLEIAEVGAWKNLMASEANERRKNLEYVIGQLELSDYIGADCCVNIAGAKGAIWDGAYRENYSEKTYEETVATVQNIIDRVQPKNTFYTLEPMPWMIPDSPECYLDMIKDIGRTQFAVHMDIINFINIPKKYLFHKEFMDNAFSVLGNYVKSCHIKDVALRNSLPVVLEEVLPGTGGFDIGHYVNRAEQINPNMPMIIEHLDTEEQYLAAIRYVQALTTGGNIA